MSHLPSILVSALSSASCVGFSGSRASGPLPSVWSSVVSAVPASVSIVTGCASGLDCFARVAFPSAIVFQASSFGSGRSSFARRSVALVSHVCASGSGVFLSFPASACPSGLFPSSSSSACFCGSGSGSWRAAPISPACSRTFQAPLSYGPYRSAPRFITTSMWSCSVFSGR